MEYSSIVALIVIVFTVIGVIGVPWLKSKGLWVVTLFAVNIAEQIFNFAKAGPKKFEWVDGILQQLMPKLTALEREMIIEQLVEKLNEFKEG